MRAFNFGGLLALPPGFMTLGAMNAAGFLGGAEIGRIQAEPRQTLYLPGGGEATSSSVVRVLP